jgi:hypothetical protein
MLSHSALLIGIICYTLTTANARPGDRDAAVLRRTEPIPTIAPPAPAPSPRAQPAPSTDDPTGTDAAA